MGGTKASWWSGAGNVAAAAVLEEQEGRAADLIVDCMAAAVVAAVAEAAVTLCVVFAVAAVCTVLVVRVVAVYCFEHRYWYQCWIQNSILKVVQLSVNSV